jgi:hypothetical protein
MNHCSWLISCKKKNNQKNPIIFRLKPKFMVTWAIL